MSSPRVVNVTLNWYPRPNHLGRSGLWKTCDCTALNLYPFAQISQHQIACLNFRTQKPLSKWCRWRNRVNCSLMNIANISWSMILLPDRMAEQNGAVWQCQNLQSVDSIWFRHDCMPRALNLIQPMAFLSQLTVIVRPSNCQQHQTACLNNPWKLPNTEASVQVMSVTESCQLQADEHRKYFVINDPFARQNGGTKWRRLTMPKSSISGFDLIQTRLRATCSKFDSINGFPQSTRCSSHLSSNRLARSSAPNVLCTTAKPIGWTTTKVYQEAYQY